MKLQAGDIHYRCDDEKRQIPTVDDNDELLSATRLVLRGRGADDDELLTATRLGLLSKVRPSSDDGDA